MSTILRCFWGFVACTDWIAKANTAVAKIHLLARRRSVFRIRGPWIRVLIILTTMLVRRVQARYRYQQWHLRMSISHDDWNEPKDVRAWNLLKRAGRLHPESGATWIECAGAYAVFDGVNSPVTQSFGLGTL